MGSSLRGSLPKEATVRRRRFGLLGRGDDRGARSLRTSLNLVITRSEQVEPVACATRSDVAPRSAVRRVGPRPDPTRSACMDEPGGTAIRPGNQHWGLSSPSRTAISQTVARREKNGGASSDSSRSMCGTAVTAKAVRPFLFLYSRIASGEEGSRTSLHPLRTSLTPRRSASLVRISVVNWSGPATSAPNLEPGYSVRIIPSARLHHEDKERILDTFARQ